MMDSDYEKLVGVYFVVARDSAGRMKEVEFQGQEWISAERVHDNIDSGTVLYVMTAGTESKIRRKIR